MQLSITLLLGGVATLVHAAGFADLAAELPLCGVSKHTQADCFEC